MGQRKRFRLRNSILIDLVREEELSVLKENPLRLWLRWVMRGVRIWLRWVMRGVRMDFLLRLGYGCAGLCAGLGRKGEI